MYWHCKEKLMDISLLILLTSLMLNFAPKVEEELFGVMSGPYDETLLIKINFNYGYMSLYMTYYICKMQNKAICLPTYVDKVFCFFLSAYEVKNNCSAFERLFKVKKSAIFLFGISFFVLEIFAFLYYANEESDDVIDSSTKTIKYWIKNISRNIGAVIFKLGTRNVHHKRNKMTPAILLPWRHHFPHLHNTKT